MLKNKKTRTFLCLMLACLCIVSALSSCDPVSKQNTLMSYSGSLKSSIRITANMYSYWMSYYKTMLVNNIYQSYGTDVSGDASFWDNPISDTDSRTTAEVFNEEIRKNIANILAVNIYCEQNGIKLSDTHAQEIEENLKSMVEQYGTKSAPNKFLKTYSIEYNTLKLIFTYEAMYTMIYEILFDEGGTHIPTEEAMKQYFMDNMYCIKFIYINNVDKSVPVETTTEPATEPAGDETATGAEDEQAGTESPTEPAGDNTATDAESTTGDETTTEPTTEYVETTYVELTPEEKAEKDKIIDKIMDRISAGENFDDIYQEMNDSGENEIDLEADYPKGYYMLKPFGEITSAENKEIFSMNVGGVKKVVNEIAGVRIIKRYETDINEFENYKDYVLDQMEQETLQNLLKDIVAGIQTDEDRLLEFNIAYAELLA